VAKELVEGIAFIDAAHTYPAAVVVGLGH